MATQRFEFTATVEVLLANGETIKRKISDLIWSRSREMAEFDVKRAIREIIYDWDCNDVDAPVEEIVGITNIRFQGR